jgi:hypothetical protein
LTSAPAGVTATDLGDGWTQVVIALTAFGDVSSASQIVFQTLDNAYSVGDTFLLTDIGFNNAGGGSSSGGSSGGQLAVNGGFEAGDLSSWTEIPNGGTITAVNDTASASTWFVNLVAGPTNAPAISLAGLGVGTVMPGDTVDVSFDMCGTAAAGGVIFPALLSEVGGGGGATRVNLATIATPPSVWTRYNYSTAAGPNVNGGVSLQLDVVCGADSGCAADVYFDNVSVTLGGGPVAGSASGNSCTGGGSSSSSSGGGSSGGSAGPNLVINGDMETGSLIVNPADGWVDSNDGGGILTPDNSVNNGGSYSAKAIASVSQVVLLKQTEIGKGVIVAGDAIEVSYDLQVAFMPPGGVVNGQIFVESDGGGVNQTEQMPTITANQGWRTETISFTVGSVDVSGGITLQFNIICGADAGCEADANIDNVSVAVIGGSSSSSSSGGTASGGSVPDVTIYEADGSAADLSPGFDPFGSATGIATVADTSYIQALELTVANGYGPALAQLGLTGLSFTGYDEFLFKVKGLTADNTIRVTAENTGGGTLNIDLTSAPDGVTATDLGDGWTQVVIALTAFGDVSSASQMAFQTLDNAYSVGDTFLMTDIGFNNL